MSTSTILHWVLTVGVLAALGMIGLWTSGRAPKPRTFRRPKSPRQRHR